MAKATFTRVFDALDETKGVSIRVSPDPAPQTQPAWVIAQAVEAGAATAAEETPITDTKGK